MSKLRDTFTYSFTYDRSLILSNNLTTFSKILECSGSAAWILKPSCSSRSRVYSSTSGFWISILHSLISSFGRTLSTMERDVATIRNGPPLKYESDERNGRRSKGYISSTASKTRSILDICERDLRAVAIRSDRSAVASRSPQSALSNLNCFGLRSLSCRACRGSRRAGT